MTEGPTRRRHQDPQRRDRSRPPAPEPLPRPVVDNHCHLDIADGPGGADGDWLATEEALEAAAAVGVTRVVQIGCDLPGARWAVDAAGRHDALVAGVALHPNEAPLLAGQGRLDAALDEIEALASSSERVRAIGETGLDYYRDHASREDQARAFAAQIEIARDTGKPLVIHTREADDDTIATLTREAAGVTVILHCFSMPQRFDECREHGWWLSYAGNVTYPRNAALAATALRVPLDRMLVETDAPYLTPQAVRKERNQPAFVVHTARFVAERRGVAYEDLEAAVERTAAGLFGW